MAIFLLLPVLLSLLAICAHFYRADDLPLVGVALACVPLLLVRRPWAARVVQLVLILSALEWVWTASTLVELRERMGQPWHRLAAILGGVALFTVLSAGVFLAPPLRRWYRIGARAS